MSLVLKSRLFSIVAVRISLIAALYSWYANWRRDVSSLDFAGPLQVWGSRAPIAITAWRIEALLSQAWSTRRFHRLEANTPVSWLAVWVLNTWKYLASCWLLNGDWCGEPHRVAEGGVVRGTTPPLCRFGNTWPWENFLGWMALLSSSYPSQPRPNLIHRWQMGRASSHLTFRILESTIISSSCIYMMLRGNEIWFTDTNGSLLARLAASLRFMVKAFRLLRTSLP